MATGTGRMARRSPDYRTIGDGILAVDPAAGTRYALVQRLCHYMPHPCTPNEDFVTTVSVRRTRDSGSEAEKPVHSDNLLPRDQQGPPQIKRLHGYVYRIYGAAHLRLPGFLGALHTYVYGTAHLRLRNCTPTSTELHTYVYKPAHFRLRNCTLSSTKTWHNFFRINCLCLRNSLTLFNI
jgi:hypothetical protein